MKNLSMTLSLALVAQNAFGANPVLRASAAKQMPRMPASLVTGGGVPVRFFAPETRGAMTQVKIFASPDRARQVFSRQMGVGSRAAAVDGYHALEVLGQELTVGAQGGSASVIYDSAKKGPDGSGLAPGSGGFSGQGGAGGSEGGRGGNDSGNGRGGNGGSASDGSDLPDGEMKAAMVAVHAVFEKTEDQSPAFTAEELGELNNRMTYLLDMPPSNWRELRKLETEAFREEVSRIGDYFSMNRIVDGAEQASHSSGMLVAALDGVLEREPGESGLEKSFLVIGRGLETEIYRKRPIAQKRIDALTGQFGRFLKLGRGELLEMPPEAAMFMWQFSTMTEIWFSANPKGRDVAALIQASGDMRRKLEKLFGGPLDPDGTVFARVEEVSDANLEDLRSHLNDLGVKGVETRRARGRIEVWVGEGDTEGKYKAEVFLRLDPRWGGLYAAGRVKVYVLRTDVRVPDTRKGLAAVPLGAGLQGYEGIGIPAQDPADGQNEAAMKRGAAEMAKDYVGGHRKPLGLRPRDPLPRVRKVAITHIASRTRGEPFDIVMARVEFARQSHQGIPVEGSEIVVNIEFPDRVLNSSGKRHLFVTGEIPERPGLSEAEARHGLVGQVLHYGFIGRRLGSYTVSLADIGEGKKVIIESPEQAGKFILVWKFRVGKAMKWDVYVDADTGEMVRTRPLFQS
ncbi:MAG: hypothetical protein HY921_03455 [Elusimicrobia bacterium]|nr:hypothetical protein [Elusimicrobiota bacterium]